jgi:hypothetical protein
MITGWGPLPPAPYRGIFGSEGSRICGKLDGEVAAFRSRPLSHIAFPYVFLDATYVIPEGAGTVKSFDEGSCAAGCW